MKLAWVLACTLSLVGTGTGAALAQPAAVVRHDDGPTAARSLSSHATAVTPLGFFWQLTVPQEVVSGKLLVSEDSPAAARKSAKRAARSDTQLFRISSTGSNDVPEAALRAYRHAADAMSCGIRWTLLAAIGRVESNHGRFGGAQLGSDGVSRPEIRGPQLNGAGAFAAIRDTDGGKLDRDKVWDRAVGPMQFLPSTWRSVARDADGDGVASPDDIDDAAMGSALYLCGAGDLSTEEGMARAAFRYNPSDYYVSLVLAFERGYQTGVFALPSPPPPPGSDDASAAKKAAMAKRKAERVKARKLAAAQQKAAALAARPTPKPRPTKTVAKPRTSSSPTHSATPKPSPRPTPTPTKPAAPQEVTLAGPLGLAAGVFSLQGRALDIGAAANQANADFDGDGTLETNRGELEGLVGTQVTALVRVTGSTGPAVLLKVGDRNYG